MHIYISYAIAHPFIRIIKQKNIVTSNIICSAPPPPIYIKDITKTLVMAYQRVKAMLQYMNMQFQ